MFMFAQMFMIECDNIPVLKSQKHQGTYVGIFTVVQPKLTVHRKGQRPGPLIHSSIA